MPISVTIEGRDSLEFDINLRAFAEQHFGTQIGAGPTPAPAKGPEKRTPPVAAKSEEESPLSVFDLPTEKPAAPRGRGRPRKTVTIDETTARHVAELQALDDELPEKTTLPGGQVVEVMDPAEPTMGDCCAALELVMTTAGEEGVERVLAEFEVERLREVPPSKYGQLLAVCKRISRGGRV